MVAVGAAQPGNETCKTIFHFSFHIYQLPSPGDEMRKWKRENEMLSEMVGTPALPACYRAHHPKRAARIWTPGSVSDGAADFARVLPGMLPDLEPVLPARALPDTPRP